MRLVRAVRYLPDDCVLVAVVDPGVGTNRRLVGVEVAGGILLGPDNGLLAPAVAMAGGARSVISLDNPDYQLPAPGPTFAGRDVLAPAAGHLAAGIALVDLGSPVEPAGLVPGLVSLPEVRDDGAIVGEVWWVDRFGNCQLNIDPDELGAGGAGEGAAVEVHVGGEIRTARWVHTYADAKPSELVLLVDSYGLLSLAFDRESAGAALRLKAGSGVTLSVEHPA
jgi:S-adenosylmethionine hydrolase